MDEFADLEGLEPLLELARSETDPSLRIAALDTAARFKLDEAAWHEIAATTRELLAEFPPGTPERNAALALAVGIPLTSMRRQLRAVADDPADPDAMEVADKLAAARDPSQARPLLGEIIAGRIDAIEWLAAMPLEKASLSADEIPSLDERFDGNARLWRALTLARLGEYEDLDAFLGGAEDTPPLFWGDPWSAYAAIAAIAPVPPAMQRRLLDALSDVEQIPEPERRRMAQLIVWAATGSADASGAPLDAPAASSAAKPEPTVDPTEAMAATATAAARRIAQRFSATQEDLAPLDEDLEALHALPADQVNDFVLDLVDAADKRADTLASTEPARQALGNDVLSVVSNLSHSVAWPVAELAVRFLGRQFPLLDTAQMGWIIARGRLSGLTRALVPELVATSERRERVLDLIGAVADVQSGRAGSPWRGAGGAMPGGASIVLIDDELETAAAPPDDFEVEATGAADALPPEERRVHAKILQAGHKRRTFLAGSDHVVRCWIGLPELGEAASDRPVQAVQIPDGGLPLTVQLLWNDTQASGTLLLPADRTGRSSDCDLRIRVPEGERYVSAEIAFLYRGRTFEVVRVEAFVLDAAETETEQHEVRIRTQIQRREVVELEDRADFDSVFVWGDGPDDPDVAMARGGAASSRASATLLQFGASGVARYSLSNATRAVKWLNEELFNTDKSLVRRRAPAGDAAVPLLDDQDAEVLSLLRQLARHGTELYNQLRGQHLADPGERIQLLNRSPDEYVPLEFVYDAGYPADDALLCAGWQSGLLGDDTECPSCKGSAELTAEERDARPVICPLGFWSLKKIIERLDPLAATSVSASAPQTSRRALGVLDRILFAASHRVTECDRKEVKEALERCVGDAALAEDWQAWRAALKQAKTLLLLALPHHGIESHEDYLEIGGDPTPASDRRVARGRLTNLYVNPHGDVPGPIVVLLGCETGATSDSGYVSLARRFQQLETSIVIGTLAKVLGRHAAQVSQELVSQLTTSQDGESDFGVIMRRVRRRMLAKGYLMALCLVSLGDADWRLSPPAQRAGNGG